MLSIPAWADTEFINESPTGNLYTTHWTISAWLEEISGIACWLNGPAGEVRAEISTEDDTSDLSGLLQQYGRGWTCITTDSNAGTFNTWGAPWRKLDPRQVSFIRILEMYLRRAETLTAEDFRGLARVLAQADHARTVPRWQIADRHNKNRNRTLRLAIGEDVTGQGQADRRSFRERLVTRGRGHGDAVEIVTLHRTSQAVGVDNLPAVVVTSSRRPGKLVVSETRAQKVEFPYPEVFTPLWPLSELLELISDTDSGK